jgi:hypothetical protein
MTFSPDDHPETLIHEALDCAARLTDDPAVRQFCQAYHSGAEEGFDPARARAVLASVWRELAHEPIEAVRRRMEEDARRDVPEPEATRWAIGGALRAALEQLVTHRGGGTPETILFRSGEAGMVALFAMGFADTARALRAAGPPPPVRYHAS